MSKIACTTACAAALVAAVQLPASASPAPVATDTEQAREQYERGRKHYELGEFAPALAAFKEAYRIKREPALLFNLGQAARQLGSDKEALFFFSQYLNARPEARNRPEVETMMGELRARVESPARPTPAPTREAAAPGAAPASAGELQRAVDGLSAAAHAAPPEVAAPSAAVQASPPPVPENAGASAWAATWRRWTKPAGYVAGGLGAIALGLGAQQYLHAKSLVDDANASYDAGGGHLGAAGASKVGSARSANTNSKVGYTVGAGLVALGAVLVFAL